MTTDALAASGLTDWRMVDGRPSAWFEVASQVAGAEFAMLAASGVRRPLDIDLRPGGVRVTIAGSAPDPLLVARAISEAARDRGLAADPSALRRTRLMVKQPNPLRRADSGPPCSDTTSWATS